MKGSLIRNVLILALGIMVAGCGSVAVKPSTGHHTPTTLTKLEAWSAVKNYWKHHGGLPSCAVGSSCYGISQIVSNVAVYTQNPGGGPGVQSDVFMIDGSRARLLMPAAGAVTAQMTRNLIPKEPTLLLTVDGSGDTGVYKGPYARAVCGGCSETQLIVLQLRRTMWRRLWASTPIAGTVEFVLLSNGHGQQGIVSRVDSLVAGETYFNGQTITVVPGDFASYNVGRPQRVWQWYKHTFVVAQVGLTVAPISSSSPYAGQPGVEVTQAGYIEGPPVNGGYGSAALPTSDSVLQPGAIITKVNGVRATNVALMALLVERTPIGQSVLIQGNANSVPFRVRVPVRAFPSGWSQAFLQIHTVPSGGSVTL